MPQSHVLSFLSLPCVWILNCNLCLYSKLRVVILKATYILCNSCFSVLVDIFILLLVDGGEALGVLGLVGDLGRGIDTCISKVRFFSHSLCQLTLLGLLVSRRTFGLSMVSVLEVIFGILFYFVLSLIGLLNIITHVHSNGFDIHKL